MGSVVSSSSGSVASSASDVLGTVSTVLIIPFIVFILWEMLHGLRRGLFRQILHTCCMLVSAALSFIACKTLMNTVLSEISATTILDLIAELTGEAPDKQIADILALVSDKTIGYVIALPLGMIVLPILFTVSFVVINFVFKIIYFIIRKIAKIEKGKGAFKRLTGMALGAIEGTLVACILFFPLATVADIGNDVATITREASNPTADTEETLDILEPIIAHPIFKFINAIGGRAISNNFCTIKIDGHRTNIRAEATLLVKVLLVEVGHLSSEDVDFAELTSRDKASLNAIKSAVSDSDYIATIFADILSGVAGTLAENEDIINADPPAGDFLTAALGIFKTSTAENLGADLGTFLEVYYLLSDSGVLASEDISRDGLTVLLTEKNDEGKTVIAQVTDIIDANPRTKLLSTALTKVSIYVLTADAGMNVDTTLVYETIKTSVNDDILSINRYSYSTEEEYIDALTTKLDSVLKDNDIIVEPDIVEDIAKHIDTEYIGKDITEIGDDELNDIILSYYDYYIEYHEDKSAENEEI